MSFPLLYQGQGLVAVDKPAGALVIPGRGEGAGSSLRELLEEELGRKLFVVHRLDRETSGVLLFALESSAHRLLSMAFEAGKIEKRYLALVEGKVVEPGLLDQPLLPSRRGRMRLARPGEAGKSARTSVRPLELFASASLVEAVPLTGRTHQIRVHLSAWGHPLLVDRQYGRSRPLSARELGGDSEEVVLERSPLHAGSLSIPRLEGIGPLRLEAPLSADMRRALELLRCA